MGNKYDFPAILAQFSFFPMGILMGYTMYVLHLNTSTIFDFRMMKFWPFVLAAGVALVTGITLTASKHHFKRYVFEHFYLMALGMIFMLIGSVEISYSNIYGGIFLGMVGHGMGYIAGMSYVNVRVDKCRYWNISMCHIWYLLGVASAVTALFTKYDMMGFWAWSFWRMNETIGTINIVASAIFLFGVIINEIFQHIPGDYNYKRSLNADFNRENEAKEIFQNKYFPVEGNASSSPPVGNQINNVTYVVFALFTKAHSIILFYYPFMYINQLVTLLVAGNRQDFYIAHWCAFAFLVLSVALLSYDLQSMFMVSCIIKIAIMIVVTCMSINFFPIDALRPMMWVFFLFMGFGYSYSDVCILTFSSLRYNELVLTVGYLLEMILVGIVYYYSAFGNIIIFPSMNLRSSDWFLNHVIAFGTILVVLLIAIYAIIPKNLPKSLLQLNNFLNGKVAPPSVVIPAPAAPPANNVQHISPYPVLNPAQYPNYPNQMAYPMPNQYQPAWNPQFAAPPQGPMTPGEYPQAQPFYPPPNYHPQQPQMFNHNMQGPSVPLAYHMPQDQSNNVKV